MKRLLLILAFIFAVAAVMSACLEMENKDEVEAGNHYNNFNDADNAILGIYSKLMGLVDRVIILNELRSDLMEIVPGNATPDMAAISNHTATADNKYCDLTPFYEVILNCNDALANFDEMKKTNRLSPVDYGYRYADVMTVRCWVYLQLAIHFGRIPYITHPLTSVKDLKNEANFPPKNFDEIITELILCMENLPTKELSLTSPLYDNITDGYNMRMLMLNKKALLGDLYLWADRYEDAATQYYEVIKEAENRVFGSAKSAYKLSGGLWDGNLQPGFQVCYARYQDYNANAFRNKWKEMFLRSSTYSELREEMITMWSYNHRFAPQYPLVEIFAPTGVGKYQLKPTAWAIDDLWDAQLQRNGFQTDGRGRNSSFEIVNGQPVVIKYLYNYYRASVVENETYQLDYNDIPNRYAVQGSWFVYRAGLLHLRYAEAANREGYTDIAHALLNNGIKDNYSWGRASGDVTGVQYTGARPAADTVNSEPYPYPFFLDARETPRNTPYTVFDSPWNNNYGIRRRAYVANSGVGEHATLRVSIFTMELILQREAALECGFEGHRWGDLLRVAMRRNRVHGMGRGTVMLNQQLQTAKPSLPYLTPETWFLPTKFVLKEEEQ
jgi:hypothetical protein